MKQMVMLFLLAILLMSGAPTPEGQSQEPESDVLRMGPGITPPKLISKLEPQYSNAARDAGIQGSVLLDLVIDERGLPQDIALLSPLGFGLDERAMKCLSQWRFKPAQKEGRPVKLRATVEVDFRLLGRSFDSQAEQRRTRFNAVVTRLGRQKDGRPNDQDLKTLQDLAKQKMPAAEYVIGSWEVNGEVLPKDVASGLASIQESADKNYGPALFFIGQALRQGNLLPKDSTKGLSLLRDGALLGSKEAEFALGAMYEKGDEVAVDLDRAKRYFRLCAAAGTPECQFRLGHLLLASPQRNERDWLQAIAWFELADSHSLAAAREVAQSEAAKLTPEQTRWVARLRSQLEQKH